MNLFDLESKEDERSFQPLAERMRPRNLSEFVGQRDVIKGYLRRMIEIGQVPSMIFYGLPGTGKTTLAKIIANATKSNANFISVKQFSSLTKFIASTKVNKMFSCPMLKMAD